MKDIIVLTGEACSGKDFILNHMVKTNGWHKMISYTTRPPRDGEVNHVDYIFITNDEFYELEKNNVIFEKTEYATEAGLWLYGLGKESLDESKTNITILNPHGVSQIINSELKDRVVVFRVGSDYEERYQRYNKRYQHGMSQLEKAEAWDRLGRDIKDFSDFDKVFSSVEYIMGESEYNIFQIDNYDWCDIDMIEEEILEIINEVNNENS